MSAVLDVVLVLVLVGYLLHGYRLGLVRSVGSLVGIVAGGIAAVLVAPLVGSLVADSTARIAATIGAALLLVVLGQAIGAGVGAVIGKAMVGPLGLVDRILGAAVNVGVAALVLSAVAGTVTALGVPFLAQPVAGSVVLRTIAAVTPPPVTASVAQLRSTLLSRGIPMLGEALGAPADTTVPATPSSSALTAAQASVVKITGTAYACGQDQSGSGFVVAKNRVLTNAHVLAGVTSPVVLRQDGQALVGHVVYFDRTADLALVDVPGLGAPSLPVAADPPIDTIAAVDGFPYGGPFTSGGARVVLSGLTSVPDIGGGGSTLRHVVTLAADVEPGNSGGPLLTRAGRVAGIVFAKSANQADVGYAMTPTQFRHVAQIAASLTSKVSTGACVRD